MKYAVVIEGMKEDGKKIPVPISTVEIVDVTA